MLFVTQCLQECLHSDIQPSGMFGSPRQLTKSICILSGALGQHKTITLM